MRLAPGTKRIKVEIITKDEKWKARHSKGDCKKGRVLALATEVRRKRGSSGEVLVWFELDVKPKDWPSTEGYASRRWVHQTWTHQPRKSLVHA